MTALLLDQVSKESSGVKAVDELSFAVPDGRVFGFLGGNGAGKTTSLRMVLDIIRPTSGRIEVLGRAPGRENSRDLGFLPEERGLYRSMSAIDTVIYFGRLKGMSLNDARVEGTKLLDRFGLEGSTKKTIDKLSKGMAQKVQLATAVVNQPKLLILDEPFSGLDPVNQGLLENEILRFARAGSTVIFSTHVMQHAERLCHSLLLLAKGRKIFEGTQEAARARLPAQLRITAQSDPRSLTGVQEAVPIGLAKEGWSDWEITLFADTLPGDLLQTCTQAGFLLRKFEVGRPSLHDVFIHLVGQQRAWA